MSGESLAPAETVARAPRTARPARPRSLLCPSCGGPLTLRAGGISVTAVCPACGAALDVANDDVRLIAAARARTRQLLLPTGTRGTLVGTEWEVVGYQQRSSSGEDGDYQWDEYLLFNPYRGFRFLSHYEDTWTLYAMLREAVGDNGEVSGDKRRYILESSSTATTDYVLGEFYWRVRVGDSVALREFVSPPYSLSEERSADEVTWSRGVALDDQTVRGAFSLAPPAAAHADEAGGGHRLRLLWVTAGIALLLLIVLASLNFGRDRNLLVVQQTFPVTGADQPGPPASDVFTVPGRGGNLQIQVTAQSARDWVDTDIALVSADGGQRFDAPFSIDLFRNQKTASYTFGSVPGGSYKLLATFKPNTVARIGQSPSEVAAGLQPTSTISVEVRRHTPSPGSIGLAFLALLAWPVVATMIYLVRRVSGLASRSEG